MLEPMHEYIFFDSHGNPWRVCPPSHPEAEAFGPNGSARPLTGFHYTDVQASTFTAGDEWVWLHPQGIVSYGMWAGRPEYWVNDQYIP